MTCAMNLKNDYLIVEKEDRPGGLCKTFYQDGFVWDYAGHFFHFVTPEIKAFFEQKISYTASGRIAQSKIVWLML